MRFGIFMAPFHPMAGQDPIAALQRDLETVQLLDKLGYDEVWVGEHHSAGTEIIPDPFMFICYAAPQTRHIKLGTGVLSLPYHNPLWCADRAFFADQLTRGRFMLGLGPGALPGDAAMIGIAIEDQRNMLEEDTEVLMKLLAAEEPVNHENDRYKLVNAMSQYRPYSNFDIAVAAIASPTGPRIAGQHGIGLLSIGATSVDGFDALGYHWDVVEERASEHGTTANRDGWRLELARAEFEAGRPVPAMDALDLIEPGAKRAPQAAALGAWGAAKRLESGLDMVLAERALAQQRRYSGEHAGVFELIIAREIEVTDPDRAAGLYLGLLDSDTAPATGSTLRLGLARARMNADRDEAAIDALRPLLNRRGPGEADPDAFWEAWAIAIETMNRAELDASAHLLRLRSIDPALGGSPWRGRLEEAAKRLPESPATLAP